MRRHAILFHLLFIILILAVTPGQAAESRIRPLGDADAVRIRIGRKTAVYHRATQAKPLEFRVEGPTPIRLVTRFLYDGAASEGVTEYELLVEIDGVTLRTLKEETRESQSARRVGGRPVGVLRRSVVQIPRGNHRVRVLPVREDASVAVRVFRGDHRPKKIKWVAYAPETYERALRLHGGDAEVIYYRFTTGTPATLTINGPLQLKVRSRLDFAVVRGHSQAYAIKVYLDGELARSYQLDTRLSQTSTYPELPEITPGVARDILFEVPDGRHEISIVLDCTTTESGALRILIPERAVTNGR